MPRTLDEIFAPTDPNFSLGTAISNIPASGARLIGDIFNAVTNPIETGKAVLKTGLGGIQKLIPGVQGDEPQFDAVVDFFKDRYGSVDSALKTIETDPVGFAADVAGAFTGAGAAVRGVGAASKIGAISKVGQTASKIGVAADPLRLAAKGAGAITKPIGRVGGILAAESLGVTTGVGSGAIKRAFRSPTPEFTSALRGTTTQENILTVARDGLQELKVNRANQYQKQLGGIKKLTKKVDISSLKSHINDQLKRFNIKRDKGGQLNFARSTIADATEAKRIQSVVNETLRWQDNTAKGLDTLKRRLDDFYSPSGEGRALTTSIRSKVKGLLTDNVPGYTKLTSNYEQASSLIKEVEKTLSLGRGVRADSTIRKLASTLKQNNEFRLKLVEVLDDITESDIVGQVAGSALNPVVPSGLIGRSIFAGAGGTAIVTGTLNPAIFAGLAFSSPRVVGEIVRALGLTAKQSSKFLEVLKKSGLVDFRTTQAVFQAGRAEKIGDDVEDFDQQARLEEIFNQNTTQPQQTQ